MTVRAVPRSSTLATVAATALATVTLGACFGMAQLAGAPAMANPADVQAQQREAFATSMGHPTQKTQQDLDAAIAQQTQKFHVTGHGAQGRLEAPAPFVIEGVRGTCYTVVMRLGADARWGRGAEAGLRFDFQAPTGPGVGGPGVSGPGAVASVGCADATGPIRLTMAPMFGADPIGAGPYTLELWSHTLSHAEAEHLAEDRRQQEEESRRFAAEEAQKKHDHEAAGCARCEARFEGCTGAGRTDCQAQFTQCEFEEAGPEASCRRSM